MAVALSIRQPWLEFILQGRKTIEVRTWSTKYRGPLLLHASRAIDRDACSHFGIQSGELAFGAILGVVDLVDCQRFTHESWEKLLPAHLNMRDFKDGLTGWILRNPRAVTPTPLPGRLGLFMVLDCDVSLAISPFSADLGQSGGQMEGTSHIPCRSE